MKRRRDIKINSLCKKNGNKEINTEKSDFKNTLADASPFLSCSVTQSKVHKHRLK